MMKDKIYMYILRYQQQNQNRVTVTDAFLSHAMRKKLCKASKKKGRGKKTFLVEGSSSDEDEVMP